MSDIETLRKAAYAADDAFTKSLRNAYGEQAGDMRYSPTLPYFLHGLLQEKLAADYAWRTACGMEPQPTRIPLP